MTFPWSWEGILYHPEIGKNITLDFIIANHFKYWDWNYICSKYDITLDIINSNPEIPWDFQALSKKI